MTSDIDEVKAWVESKEDSLTYSEEDWGYGRIEEISQQAYDICFSAYASSTPQDFSAELLKMSESLAWEERVAETTFSPEAQAYLECRLPDPAACLEDPDKGAPMEDWEP